MTCPHCDHKVPLTWGRYFKSAFGHHLCPSCGKRFKIILTVSSVALVLVVTIIAAGMPAVITFFFVHNFWWTITAYLFFLLGLVLPFDRWLDNKIRPTKPVH